MDLATLSRRLEALEGEQERLRDERGQLEEEQKRLRGERDSYKALYLEMLERCRKLELGLMGQKSERLRGDDGQQLSLAMLELVLSNAELADLPTPEETEEVRGHQRRKPTGRKPLPDDLPRVDIVIIPPEVEHEGLDAFERIGEEVTEVLERRPASMVVARVIKPKYKRRAASGDEGADICVGITPELPIPRGLAGPGFLADTIVKRWDDHQPLHRLERVYARDGIELARSTMCGWHEQLAALAEPLVAAMRADAFAQPLLLTDATGVLVQAKEQCRRGHFWVMVSPDRHVLFEYTARHDKDAVDGVLAGYEGYLVADAHAVYDHLYAGGRVTEVNCWAHARRYFFKALGSDPDRAKVALEMIGGLFKVERAIATAPRKKRERIRGKHSRPIVERFFSWCDAEATRVLDDTPIAAGIRYARNQREGLSRFLTDGRLPLHNNLSELNLRRQAVGRKNWLFVGSDEGGRTNAIFTSLLASCRMHRVEPWSYLRDLFCLLPGWSRHRVLELSPLRWAETQADPDVQARLALDPYRVLTLGG